MTLEEQRAHIRSGRMYNDLSPELVEARKRAVLLTNEYNASFGDEPARREALLRILLGSVGKSVYFEPTFRCEFGFNIWVGDNFYANFDGVMLDGGALRSETTYSSVLASASTPPTTQSTLRSERSEGATRSQ